MKNSYASVSPCGRFFGACGFTADVKIWEVCFEKNGDFHEIRRAFELKGHSAGVYNFSFNSDSTRMASVSKDGTWRLWNTNSKLNLIGYLFKILFSSLLIKKLIIQEDKTHSKY